MVILEENPVSNFVVWMRCMLVCKEEDTSIKCV